MGIAVAALVETVVLAWIQAQNSLGFYPTQADLGSYNQAFATTVHGQGFFYYSVNLAGGSNGSLWGTHFFPTIVLLLPVYAIAPSPTTLLCLKQVALAFGAIPVYGIARVYFRRQALPVLFATLYLVSPLTLGIDWNSFDPEAFLPITFLAAMYFFTKGRFWPFLVCWILALGTIEGAPVFFILFAAGGLVGTLLVPSLSPYWTRRRERQALLVALGVAAAWLVMAYLVLEAVGGRGGGFGSAYAIRYTTLGATSFQDVIPQALTHPGNAAAALQYGGSKKILFLEILILATGGLCVFGGLRYLLPFTGLLGLSFLSNNAGLYTLGTEYTGLILGFLFVASIEGTVVIVDLLNSTKAGQRRRELEARLRAEARALLNIVATVAYDQPLQRRVLAQIQSATALLNGGLLGPAEAELIRLRRLVNSTLSVPAAAQAVPVGAGGAGVPGKPVSPVEDTHRAWSLPTGADGMTLLPFAIVVIAILVASAVSNPLVGHPVAGSTALAWGYPGADAHDQVLDSVLQLIPPLAPVLTTSHLFTALSERPDVYLVNNGLFIKNGTVSDVLNRWADQSNYIALDYQVDPTNTVILLNDTSVSAFGLSASEDGALLYERGWTGPPAHWSPWITSLAGGQLTPHNGFVGQQFGTSLGPSYYHPAGLGGVNGSLWSGPNLVYLPHGFYNVTFNLELLAPTSGPQLAVKVVEYPAIVIDDNSSLPSYHMFRIASSGSYAVLRESKVDTSSAISVLTPMSVTVPFVLTSNEYVNFPGFELSTTMSLYLVSVQLVESSSLP